MFRKVVTLLVSTFMLLVCFAVPAKAEGDGFSASPTTVEPGDTFTVQFVTTHSVSGVGDYRALLTYSGPFTAKDLKYTQYSDVGAKTGIGNSVDEINKDKRLVIDYQTDEDAGFTVPGNKNIFTVTFTVDDTAEKGTYTFDFDLSVAEPIFSDSIPGEQLTTSATVTVAVNADSIAVSPKTLNLEEGKTGDLTATLTPTEAENEVTWSSSDEKVATVANGKVTGVAEGTATITATTDNGKSDTATVTVTHVHTYDETKWENDENTHWHPCTKDDGARGSEAAHTFGTPVVKTAATCTKEGVQVETCTECGYEKESPIPVAAHTLKEIPTVDPTHEKPGNVRYWQCEVCNQLFSDNEGKESTTAEDTVLDPVPYDWSEEWTTSAEKHWHECNDGCGTKKDEADHTFEWVTDKEPTCKEPGSKHQECTVCGEKGATEAIPVIDHTFEWVIDKEPTCKEPGSKHEECTVCGEKGATEEIPVIDHTFEWVTDKEPTCKEPGSKHEECTVCGEKGATEEIPVIDHTFEWVTVKEATCEEDGSRHEECTVCHETGKTEVLPATGHKFEWVTVKEPTCDEDGSKHEECSVCHKEGKVEVLPATGHKFEWITDKEPTCDEDGSKHEECTVCHKTGKTEVLPATGHKFEWITDKEPTCEEDGSKHEECTVCHKTGQTEVLPATGHKFEWITDKEPTCEEDGSKHEECTVCHKTGKTEVLPATGHDIVEVPGKEATHFADGVKTYYECKVCHKKFKDKDGKEALTDEEFNSDYVIPMIPHTYSEEWSHDANRHYHECTNKDGAIDEKTAEAHKWTAWKTVKEATVSAAGSQERVCEICGRKETKEIAKLPDNKVPNTADSNHTGMYLGMMLIALVSACGAVFFRKRVQ